MLYAAYGSNLNISQMSLRCPAARVIGRDSIDGVRMMFRGVADIVRDPKASCPIGVWEVTSKCLVALDRYEGFPRLYNRCLVNTKYGQAIVYYMNHDHIDTPSAGYYQTIEQGYADFGLDFNSLVESLHWSINRVGETIANIKQTAKKGK